MTTYTVWDTAKIAAAAVDADYISEWKRLQADLETVKTAELAMRTRLAKVYFPAPVEGTQKFRLNDVDAFSMVYPINRKLDDALLIANQEMFIKEGVPIANLVARKPELVTAEYRKLEEAEDKKLLNLFNLVVTATPGTPQLKIVQPKRW